MDDILAEDKRLHLTIDTRESLFDRAFDVVDEIHRDDPSQLSIDEFASADVTITVADNPAPTVPALGS